MRRLWLFCITGLGAVFSTLGYFAWYYDFAFYGHNPELKPLFLQAKLGHADAQFNLGFIHSIDARKAALEEDYVQACRRYRHAVYWYQKSYETYEATLTPDLFNELRKVTKTHEEFRNYSDFRQRCRDGT